MKLVLVSDGKPLKRSSGVRLLVTPAINQHYKMELENQIKILGNDLHAKDDHLKQKEIIILRDKYKMMSTD